MIMMETIQSVIYSNSKVMSVEMRLRNKILLMKVAMESMIGI